MATNHIPNLEGCIIEKFDLACMNTLKKMRVENEWENGEKKGDCQFSSRFSPNRCHYFHFVYPKKLSSWKNGIFDFFNL